MKCEICNKEFEPRNSKKTPRTCSKLCKNMLALPLTDLSKETSTMAAMKFFVDGEKGKALCPQCGGLVNTTFCRRNVPFSDRKGKASQVLVSVCDACDTVLGVPAQSTPAVREARQKVMLPLEANLPAVYLDVLDLAEDSLKAAIADYKSKQNL